MTFPNRIRVRALASAALLGLVSLPGAAWAQEIFPSKTVKFIVPYPPGASTDSLARAFAQELAKELKGNVIVENKPGGGTTIGALAVKTLPADGHALLFQVDGLYNGKLAAPSVGYEYSDFEILSALAQTPYALVVPASLNIQRLEDLKAHAAKKNGEIDFGVLGMGANQYSILGRSLSKHLGVTPRMIPYKGGVEGVTAVMAGEIDAYFATVGLAHAQKDNPKLKFLALTSDAGKNKFFPSLKSFAELGVKDMVFKSLYGVAIRSNTPAGIKARLEQAVRKVADSEEMKKVRAQISLEDYPGSVESYRAEVQRNLQMYQAAQEQEPRR
ncbi:tripartite tricarboxylate transporter substrate binding protein [Polaromonas eurypsychrophila]|uniref:Tripartite tricarboxylate transporter substrate binding protein n=1 Tax=Polaromonas eurypsychrophila TaxID=1614635 RepID=A0A916SC28_9BURK|nr:tripartite tricarboxylate transporter substrate binding protein [Polaromonas eurypsychrophila]GGA90664.1 hypothetical protein GCM10011496_09470 [Polaromonas eurypsychrophila]